MLCTVTPYRGFKSLRYRQWIPRNSNEKLGSGEFLLGWFVGAASPRYLVAGLRRLASTACPCRPVASSRCLTPPRCGLAMPLLCLRGSQKAPHCTAMLHRALLCSLPPIGRRAARYPPPPTAILPLLRPEILFFHRGHRSNFWTSFKKCGTVLYGSTNLCHCVIK